MGRVSSQSRKMNWIEATNLLAVILILGGLVSFLVLSPYAMGINAPLFFIRLFAYGGIASFISGMVLGILVSVIKLIKRKR